MPAIIWGTANCSFCSKAKVLLQEQGIEYSEMNLGENCTKDDLVKILPQVTKVPQIFIDNVHIGGYNDLVEYFNSK